MTTVVVIFGIAYLLIAMGRIPPVLIAVLGCPCARVIPEAGQPRSGIYGVVPASLALALVDGLGFWARWASLISSGVGGTRANQS